MQALILEQTNHIFFCHFRAFEKNDKKTNHGGGGKLIRFSK